MLGVKTDAYVHPRGGRPLKRGTSPALGTHRTFDSDRSSRLCISPGAITDALARSIASTNASWRAAHDTRSSCQFHRAVGHAHARQATKQACAPAVAQAASRRRRGRLQSRYAAATNETTTTQLRTAACAAATVCPVSTDGPGAGAPAWWQCRAAEKLCGRRPPMMPRHARDHARARVSMKTHMAAD